MLVLQFSLLIVTFWNCTAEVHIQSSRNEGNEDKQDLSMWGYQDQSCSVSTHSVTITETSFQTVSSTITVTTTKSSPHTTICPSQVTTTVVEQASTIYVRENSTVANQSEIAQCQPRYFDDTAAPGESIELSQLSHLDTVLALSALSILIVILTLVAVLCAARASQIRKNTRGMSKKTSQLHKSFRKHIFREENVPIVRTQPVITHPHLEPELDHEYVALEDLNQERNDIIPPADNNVILYPPTQFQNNEITVEAQVYDQPESADIHYETPSPAFSEVPLADPVP